MVNLIKHLKEALLWIVLVLLMITTVPLKTEGMVNPVSESTPLEPCNCYQGIHR